MVQPPASKPHIAQTEDKNENEQIVWARSQSPFHEEGVGRHG